MAIDLLNRFTTAQVNNTTKVTNASPVAVDSTEAARIVRSVYALKAGDSLQGELISAKGTDISLLLGESVTLNAKLDKELSLTPGQIMTFSVNSNKHGKLSLTPLFANTGMEENASKALDAASIPVTDKTLAMAQELMKQGMPINKQTLTMIFRQMGMFPEAEVTDLVMLNKMNLPVNSETISMMHLYQTNQQYLFSDLQGLSNQLAGFVSEMVSNGQMGAIDSFIEGFVQIFASGKESIGAEGQSINGNLLNQNATHNSQLQMPAETVELSVGVKESNGQIGNENNTGLMNHLNPTEINNASLNASQSSNEAELLELLHKNNIHTPDGKEELSKSLFSILKEQMLMKPEKMDSADYVKSFYERLDEQMGKLQELIKSAGKEDSALAKEVSIVKSNVQFMNQINEMYHYVQLPIKMNDAQTNGDLYVYKRKHAKTGDDGKLTALLHLSMPTLGNMDVFLSLEEQKLSTRFCMEKEEMIDFIESNIDRLNERLMKKGYQVQTSVTTGVKEDKTVIEQILENELPIPIMTSQSFDARC